MIFLLKVWSIHKIIIFSIDSFSNKILHSYFIVIIIDFYNCLIYEVFTSEIEND